MTLQHLPRKQLGIYLFYLAVVVLITWPLVTVMSGQLVGDETSDAYEMGRHIWWFKYALQTGRPLFFQPMLGYPDGISGVSLWADPLQFFPAWLLAFVMPVPGAYNLTVLLTMALNGWAMYWLARHLLDGDDGPALLAGLVFMLFPTMQGHLLGGHAGLLVMWPVPLYLYALFRLLDTPNRRWLALAVLFFVLSPTGHALQIIYVLMPLTGMVMLALVARRSWGGLWRVAVVSITGGVGLLVFLLPVVGETVATPAYTQAGGTVRYSIDLLGIVSPSFQHPFFGGLAYTRRVLGTNLVEGSVYIGVIVGSLALIGTGRRGGSPWHARWWLLVALAAWVLALGPLLKVFDMPITIQSGEYESHLSLPWALVEHLPFFELARTPGRFGFVLALALAMLAGAGAAVLWRRWIRTPMALRWALLLVVMGGITWEYQFFWPVPRVSGTIPEAITALSQRRDVRAVFNVPWDHMLAAKEALYLQTGHEKPLAAGHVTRQTPVSPARLSLLQDTLDLALLNEGEIDIVIVHKYWDVPGGVGPVENFTRQRLGAPIYEDDRFAVFDVPETPDSPDFAALLTDQTATPDYADSYLYAPEPGWFDLTARLTANDRAAALYLDGERLHTWNVSDSLAVHVPVPVGVSGYHTVTLALDPPCPQRYNPTLTCRALQISGLELVELARGVLYEPIQLEKGVTLASAYIPAAIQAGDNLPVRLWWHFDEPRSPSRDVRFVHVLDRSGQRAAQIDSDIGDRPAGSEWVELLNIPLPADLSPGVYSVYTGWYTYPDQQRFAVLADKPGAQNGLVYLGVFRLGD